MKRARSNDGARSSLTTALPIAPGLLAKLLAEFSEPRAARVPRIFHGPKPVTGGSPKVRLTDEQVLAVRRMRDWHGMSVRQIAEATAQPLSYITAIIKYENRVHLDPGPRPAPAKA